MRQLIFVAFALSACARSAAPVENTNTNAESQPQSSPQPVKTPAKPQCISREASAFFDACDAAKLYGHGAQAGPAPAKGGRGKRPIGFVEETAHLAPRPFTAEESALGAAYANQGCLQQKGTDLVRVIYRRARIHYVANHWQEAALLFGHIAHNHPGHEVAPLAANLYLDCLNAIAQLHPQRRIPCRDQLATAVQDFIVSGELMADEELRQQLTSLQCAILWTQAQAFSEAQLFTKAAERFEQIFDGFADDCEHIGGHDICEVLYNAAINREAAYDHAKAIELRERMVSECGPSPWATKALYQLAGSYEATGDRYRAARTYEAFVKQHPGQCQGPSAASKAFKLQLDETLFADAMAMAQLFEKNYARRQRFKSASAAFAFLAGVGHLVLASWTDAESHYRSFLKRYGSNGETDLTIRARIFLGRAQYQQGGNARNEGLRTMGHALSLVDGAKQQGLSAEAARQRYKKLVKLPSERATSPYAKARLFLLVSSIAGARKTLGTVGPEQALLPTLGMSLSEAVDAERAIPVPVMPSHMGQCHF